jgi:hypothetical protein
MIKHILITLVAILICTLSKAQNTLAEYHYEADGVTDVFVTGSFCDVAVTVGDQLRFDGIIEGSGNEGDYLITSIKNGGTVIFKVEKNTKMVRAWEHVRKAQFDIEVPPNVNLTIDNSSGDVSVIGVEGDNHKIETTSGDLNLENMIGALTGRSTSGDISVTRLKGNIQMNATSGDQYLSGIAGDIDTKSTSGNIEIKDLKGDLTAQATSGDIEMDEISGKLNLKTTSGNIEGNEIEMQELLLVILN